jgi:RNA-directed DNA polymerase
VAAKGELDQMFTFAELEHAWKQLKKNKFSYGLDGMTIDAFRLNLHTHLCSIEKHLAEGTYAFAALRGVPIPKPDSGKIRPIQVRDRVVAKAIAIRLEPKLAPFDLPNSFGYRRGIGRDTAVDAILKLAASGRTFVLEADIKNFFGEVSQEILFKKLEPLVLEKSLFELIKLAICNEIGNRAEVKPHDACFPKKGEGIPQGAVLSPLLANFYMYSFDKLMDDSGYKVVRYADDFVAMCVDEAEAKAVAQLAKDHLESELKLAIHPLGSAKTKIVSIASGFDFLGFRIKGAKYYPAPKNIENVKKKISNLLNKKTGKPLMPILRTVSDSLQGWRESFKKSDMAAAALDINLHTTACMSLYLTKNKFLSGGATVSKRQLRMLGVPII